MIDNYIFKNELYQCHLFLVCLYGMTDMYSCHVLSYKVSIFYDGINQLMIFGIDNYHMFSLFSAIYIHKRRNLTLCYNFTYNQKPWKIIVFVN